MNSLRLYLDMPPWTTGHPRSSALHESESSRIIVVNLSRMCRVVSSCFLTASVSDWASWNMILAIMLSGLYASIRAVRSCFDSALSLCLRCNKGQSVKGQAGAEQQKRGHGLLVAEDSPGRACFSVDRGCIHRSNDGSLETDRSSF